MGVVGRPVASVRKHAATLHGRAATRARRERGGTRVRRMDFRWLPRHECGISEREGARMAPLGAHMDICAVDSSALPRLPGRET